MKEFCNPYRVFKKFFKYQPFEKWRHDWAAYNLLMVLDNHDPLNAETAEAVIQKLFGDQLKITMTVLSMSDLFEKLEEGNFFLSVITRSALVLINRNNSFKQPGSQKGKLSTVEMYRETWLAVEQKIHQAKTSLDETKAFLKMKITRKH